MHTGKCTSGKKKTDLVIVALNQKFLEESHRQSSPSGWARAARLEIWKSLDDAEETEEETRRQREGKWKTDTRTSAKV